MRTVTIGPFGVHFTNRNQAMGLRAHSHFAEVTVGFSHGRATPGFPSFGVTNAEVALVCRRALEHPITGTNEDVVQALWDSLAGLAPGDPPFSAWPGSWALASVELAVRGVPDSIGHDDSFTRYRIED